MPSSNKCKRSAKKDSVERLCLHRAQKVRYSELVLDNLGEDILDVQSGSTHLLWNETSGCHAWCCVDLKQVDAVRAILVFRDDIVDADNAIAVHDAIDARRERL